MKKLIVAGLLIAVIACSYMVFFNYNDERLSDVKEKDKIIIEENNDINSEIMKETTNEVIEKLANKFNVAFINNILLDDTIYHLGDNDYINTVHYNDLGYLAFTNQLINNTNNLNDTLIKRLLP